MLQNRRVFAKMAKTPPPIFGHLRGKMGKLVSKLVCQVRLLVYWHTWHTWKCLKPLQLMVPNPASLYARGPFSLLHLRRADSDIVEEHLVAAVAMDGV